MTLWTIQPEELYHSIMQTGIYICDPQQFGMPEFSDKYDWLVQQMKEQIGVPPEEVIYPVWAWYMQNSKHQKPDLRSERWCYGSGGERFVCLEIEVPDEQVLLSDFDLWGIILNNGLISETEEDITLEKIYQSLPPDQQLEMKYENWKRVFDISLLDTTWMRRGEWIQATFWLLTKDMIKDVRYFTAAYRQSEERTVKPNEK